MYNESQIKHIRSNVIYQIRHKTRIQKTWILFLADSSVFSSPICASDPWLVLQENNFLRTMLLNATKSCYCNLQNL